MNRHLPWSDPKKIACNFILPFILLLLLGCKKPDDTNSAFTISGLVVNEANAPMSNVGVELGANSVTTASDGSFSFTTSPDKPLFSVTATSAGYFTGYANISNIDNSSASTRIMLIAKPQIGTIPAAGGTITASGIRIIATSSTFTEISGTPYTGTVKIFARYIRQDDVNFAAMMPGADFRAIDPSNEEGVLESYGFVATEFTTTAGNKLLPAAGTVKVAIQIPASLGDPIVKGAKAWAYKQAEKLWRYSGEITKVNNEYFVPVTTEFENVDAFYRTRATIEGIVLCTNGDPAKNKLVRVFSSRNSYLTSTNANGRYRVSVAVSSLGTDYSVFSEGSTVPVTNVTTNTTRTASNIVTVDCPDNGGSSFKLDNINYTGVSLCDQNTPRVAVQTNPSRLCNLYDARLTTGNDTIKALSAAYFLGLGLGNCPTPRCPFLWVNLNIATIDLIYIAIDGIIVKNSTSYTFNNVVMVSQNDYIDVVTNGGTDFSGKPKHYLSGKIKCQ
ncbi:MAG: carboxypeptidase-like regulatory domain-containing protein [Chitinophagaceae bacterium]